MNEVDLCRLCALQKDDYLSVFGTDGARLQIAGKIKKILNIEVRSEELSLPQKVCLDCLYKLDMFDLFLESSLRAQITLSLLFPQSHSKPTTPEQGHHLVDHLNTSVHQIERYKDCCNGVVKSEMANNDRGRMVAVINSNQGDCFHSLDNHFLSGGSTKEGNSVDSNSDDGRTSIDTKLSLFDSLSPPSQSNCNSLDGFRSVTVAAEQNSHSVSGQNGNSEMPVAGITNNVKLPSPVEPAPEGNETDIRNTNVLAVGGGRDNDCISRLCDHHHNLQQNCPSENAKHHLNSSSSLILQHQSSNSFLCSDCSEVLLSIEDLINHHTNEHHQDAKFMCSICSKILATHKEYELHMERHSIPSCEYCSKEFCDKKTLERHRKIHTMARPYICAECGKAFRIQSALSIHIKCHLPEEVKEKFPCNLCNKKFVSKANLTTHSRIHDGVRNFTCDQCGKGFVQKGNLDSHLLTHSLDKPFTCPDCHRTFKTRVHLKKHRTVHSGDRPFQCDVCGKAFRERKTLKEHQRVHTGVLPYSCDYCGKAFRFKGVLATHKRQHTGERPYSCVECEHHFTNWPNYSKHMKRRHGIDVSGRGKVAQITQSSGASVPLRGIELAVVPPQSHHLDQQQQASAVNQSSDAMSHHSMGTETIVQHENAVHHHHHHTQHRQETATDELLYSEAAVAAGGDGSSETSSSLDAHQLFLSQYATSFEYSLDPTSVLDSIIPR